MRSVRSIDVKSDRLTFFSINIHTDGKKKSWKRKKGGNNRWNKRQREKRKKQACVKKDACQSPVADNRGYKTRLVTFLVRRHDAIDSVYISVERRPATQRVGFALVYRCTRYNANYLTLYRARRNGDYSVSKVASTGGSDNDRKISVLVATMATPSGHHLFSSRFSSSNLSYPSRSVPVPLHGGGSGIITELPGIVCRTVVCVTAYTRSAPMHVHAHVLPSDGSLSSEHNGLNTPTFDICIRGAPVRT